MNCKICNKEFTRAYKANKQLCCSPECSKINKYKLSKKSAKRLNDECSKRFGLPIHIILQYSPKFLEENPMVVETLKLGWFMNGRSTSNVGENEALKIRRKISYTKSNKKVSDKKIDKWSICRCCNKEYNKTEQIKAGRSNNITTCSITCKETVLKDYFRTYKKEKRNKI